MIARCHTDQLEKAVRIAASFLPPRIILSDLRTVILSAGNDEINVIYNSLETLVQVRIPAQVDRDGTVVVPLTILSEVLAELPKKETVQLETPLTKGGIVIEVGRTKIHINSPATSNLPTQWPPTETLATVSVSTVTFASAVKFATVSANRNVRSPLFASVMFQYRDGILAVAATDGYQLSVADIPATGDNAADFIVIASLVTKYTEGCKLLKLDGDTTIRLAKDATEYITMENGNLSVSIRTINHPIPHYRRLLAESDQGTTVVVDRLDLLRACDICTSVVADDEVLRMTLGQDGITLTGQRGKSDTVVSHVELRSISGLPHIGININGKYLHDGLRAFQDAEVSIRITGEREPVLIRGTDPNRTYVVMPIVSDE